MIGRTVGKYRILDQIGEGGMGVVYQAEHVVLGSPAAVKVLLPQFTRDETVVDRFFTEAKASSAIRHVGIVEVFDYGRLPNAQAYIAMELLRGEALSEVIHRMGPLSAPLAAEITKQALAALNATHAVGVIHRDLKPDNLFLCRDVSAPGGLRVKVLDFGIAKLLTDNLGAKAKTQSGSILGTPAYMSPEQCKGGLQIDGRADLYALGCILFQMLTGEPPYVADGGGEVMAMQIYQPPPRLPPHLADLDGVLAKLLAKRPDERAPSAAYALAMIERLDLPHLDGEVPLANTEPVRPSLSLEPVDLQTDEGLPRWIPVAVILGALALAAIAVYVIGFSGLL